jgi:uncharacterized membrane protein YheB (UPF0754 family)
MNKSLLTNGTAAIVVLVGFAMPGLEGKYVLNTGLYALSGAATNWLALYMLFEKIPFFYGSGVIPARFDDFRVGIRQLVMEQFFNEANLQRFFAAQTQQQERPAFVEALLEDVNFDRAFDGLIEVVKQSSLGGMLMMFGGEKALQPMREPFIEKMQAFIVEAGSDPALLEKLNQGGISAIISRVEGVVDQRLSELTPNMVKELVQNMISRHLGWLVVWGGVLGGLIGLLVTALIEM